MGELKLPREVSDGRLSFDVESESFFSSHKWSIWDGDTGARCSVLPHIRPTAVVRSLAKGMAMRNAAYQGRNAVSGMGQGFA